MSTIATFMIWSTVMCLPVFILFGVLIYTMKDDAKIEKLMQELQDDG